jgi:membrane-associated phospholipid phosphatase
LKKLFILFSIFCIFLSSQKTWGQIHLADTLIPKNHKGNLNPFIIPSSLILTGSVFFDSHLNKEVKKIVGTHQTVSIDNYFQYTPACLTFGMEVFGIKGKHSLKQKAIIYGFSSMIVSGIVLPVKYFSHELRPDGSNYYSFPSGHTAAAFASAELMRIEYRESKPWLCFVGYLIAGSTGYLRLYNNKHWISDVITGAGIGILSTKIAANLVDYYVAKSNKKHTKTNSLLFLPGWQNNQLGFNIIKQFH